MIAFPGIIQDTLSNSLKNLFLIGIFASRGLQVAIFFFLKLIKGPEGKVKRKSFFLLSIVGF